MRAALIGMPYSGKTMMFEALSGILSGRKEESIASIKVPDERIDFLCGVFNPAKKTLAEFVLSDFNAGEARDEGLPAKLRNMLQKMDVLILVLRDFDSIMTSSPRDPAAEYSKLREELVLSDFVIAEKRLEREAKEHKNPPEIPAVVKIRNSLEQNRMPSEEELTAQELELLSNYSFLSLKKKVALVNKPEGEQEIPLALKKMLDADGIPYFAVSATLEKEMNDIPPEDKKSFLESFGLKDTAKDRLLETAYKAMNLISFLTVGPDEVRAWPIRRGMSAVEAAGRIHTDIARGFIRAEVVPYEVFKSHGSEEACKKANAYRLVGKDYIVQDGDLMEFRFNV
jgi:ribosome-binding ATPase YchF (GTP1/OBG family)